MSFVELIRSPDVIHIQTDDGWEEMESEGGESWNNRKIEVSTIVAKRELPITVAASDTSLKRIKIRWSVPVGPQLRFLGDAWERGYGDLEWRGLVPDRVMPWYFLAYDGRYTHGYGVKTGAGAMCFWQVDTAGVTLVLDVRNGGSGVILGNRKLEPAVVVTRRGAEGETAFQAAAELCTLMCDAPRLPAWPVYGGNNWYYTYGTSSHDEILADSNRISDLAVAHEHRPFMVIDDGWQLCHYKSCHGGPWSAGNFRFPDMYRLAREMQNTGVRPGIWIRPLLTSEMVPDDWVLPNTRLAETITDQFLDPSVPGVLEHVGKDIERLISWGYELIKHDFTTWDIFGRWGFEMGNAFTEAGWSFKDRSRTTAEIISGLYSAIRKAAGDAIIIGCNTIGHLGAGLFEVQRTGDDTSGREWERTRKMGVNTLAFRMAQHGNFFASDADCVGLTEHVPWQFNRQWLDLLSRSGTPLFVSADPDAVGAQQKAALKQAFRRASVSRPPGEPLDWLTNICPAEWRLEDEVVSYDWYGKDGAAILD